MQVLRVEQLSKVYGSGELAVTALRDVSFSVRAGELVALLGPSGSGKTTLLLCISMVLEPTAGLMTFGSQEIFRDKWIATDLRRLRREHIGFIFQGHNLIPFLTARENVILTMNLTGTKGKAASQRADELLEYMEIRHRADALPATLSGGEQQRLAVARAIANRPQLILADEPTASLDTSRGMKVMAMLRAIAKERNSAVITVTHDERMVAGFDTVYRLKDGSLTNGA